MKIPKSIINRANKIINNARTSSKLEAEIMSWIISKGIELDSEGDVIASLMYGEYKDGEEFAEVLSREMDRGNVM